MRLIFNFVITLASGLLVAAAVAFVVGLVLPSLKVPLFLAIAVWWLWTGWKYAKARDQGQF